jgi:hypothetical protein
MFPLFRFARYEDGSLATESLASDKSPFRPQLIHMVQADGPMRVDCRRLEKVGIVFYPRSTGFLIYGKNTKYRLLWLHSAFPGQEERDMRYKRNTPGGFIAARLALDEWLVNGVVSVQVSVANTVVFSTQFELDQCKANLYRSPVVPSQLELELELERERERAPQE